MGFPVPMVFACLFGLAWAGTAAAQFECPYQGLPEGVSMEIAEIRYVEEVRGVDGNVLRIAPEQRDRFRIALVTIRVTKPAGRRLTVAAADFTLHYNHGSAQEVAPCEGISSFSRELEGERNMKMPRMMGPGWIKQTTGLRATEATEVYFDAVFHLVEPEIREVWLCVAQPTRPQAFLTRGSMRGNVW